MPYRKDKTQPLTRLLRGYGYTTGPELAKILGVTAPTARSKLLDPKKLTVGDLEKVEKLGHIPIEEIRAAIGAKA